MTTMLIAQNQTRESGSFMGDQLCSLKTAYCFLEGQPDVDRVIMSVSPGNEMHFLWEKFIDKYKVQLVWDDWNPGDWNARWAAWDIWRIDRRIQMNDGRVEHFDHYRELYLRIHGAQRQLQICGEERGLNRRNIYEYWLAGQENRPESFLGSDWFDDSLINHLPHKPERDVYISPLAKTQGNYVFTFDFWSDVIHRLVDADVTVTVGFPDDWFCHDLAGHPNYRRYYGTHQEWMAEVCQHKLVACGNTGTGWLAAACGVPMITMEPHQSVMADHRYRECGLRNIVEVVDGTKLDEFGCDMTRVAGYVTRRIIEEVKRCVVMTTGCYDILHAGHVHHLQRAKAMGTKLIVALNSDASVRLLKGNGRPINPESQRRTVLEALRCVDEVKVFHTKDATSLIEEVKPDILACGYGYTPDKIIGRDIVEGYGGKVVVTCDKDASNEEVSTTKIAKRMSATTVWSAVRAGAPYSVNPPEKIRLMAEEFLKVKDLPGDVADLGAFRGGTSLILRRLAPDKDLHIFDTWAGNPYDDPLCHHKKGEWSASLVDCQILVGMDNKIHYHQGVFPDTAWKANDAIKDLWQFCFVYVDMDCYQSTKDALEFFWPRLVTGGKIVVDDYGWEPCAGVKKAADEYFPPKECERYGHSQTGLPGVPQPRVIQSLYTWIVEKR